MQQAACQLLLLGALIHVDLFQKIFIPFRCPVAAQRALGLFGRYNGTVRHFAWLFRWPSEPWSPASAAFAASVVIVTDHRRLVRVFTLRGAGNFTTCFQHFGKAVCQSLGQV
jgi:hypothetical protein